MLTAIPFIAISRRKTLKSDFFFTESKTSDDDARIFFLCLGCPETVGGFEKCEIYSVGVFRKTFLTSFFDASLEGFSKNSFIVKLSKMSIFGFLTVKGRGDLEVKFVAADI